MTLCYVSGPYTKNEINGKTQEENILQAHEIGCRLWENGFSVIVPHENTSYFEKDCKINYDDYIRGDLDILSRCDYIVMTPDWKSSKGAKIEYDYAVLLGIAIYIYPDIPQLLEKEKTMPNFVQMIRENCMNEYREKISKFNDGSLEIGVCGETFDEGFVM